MFEQDFNYHDKLWPDTESRTLRNRNKIITLTKMLEKTRANLAKEKESIATTQHIIAELKSSSLISLTDEDTSFEKYKKSLSKRKTELETTQEIIATLETEIIPKLIRDIETAKQNLSITLHQCMKESLPAAKLRQDYIDTMKINDLRNYESCWRRIFADLGMNLCINDPAMMPNGWEEMDNLPELKEPAVSKEPTESKPIESKHILTGVVGKIKDFVSPEAKPDTKEPGMVKGSRRTGVAATE